MGPSWSCVKNKGEALEKKSVELVAALNLASSKASIGDEETLHPFDQAGACSIVKIGG